MPTATRAILTAVHAELVYRERSYSAGSPSHRGILRMRCSSVREVFRRQDAAAVAAAAAAFIAEC